MPSVRMATNDAADMCLSMKIPLLSLKVEDKDVRDHFDIMHLAKDGKKHLENGNKYLSNNVYKLYTYDMQSNALGNAQYYILFPRSNLMCRLDG